MRDALVEHEDAALRVPASRVVLDYQAPHADQRPQPGASSAATASAAT